jgi:hypothetical protein
MSLARRFNAGDQVLACSRRVATIEFALVSSVATRREHFLDPFPALKGRAKFVRTLRVEKLIPTLCGILDQGYLKFIGHQTDANLSLIVRRNTGNLSSQSAA